MVLGSVPAAKVPNVRLRPGMRLVAESDLPAPIITRDEIIADVGLGKVKKILSTPNSGLFVDVLLMLTQEKHELNDPAVIKLVEDMKANKNP